MVTLRCCSCRRSGTESVKFVIMLTVDYMSDMIIVHRYTCVCVACVCVCVCELIKSHFYYRKKYLFYNLPPSPLGIASGVTENISQ